MNKKAKVDPLDELASGDLTNVIQLMLWKNRMREPDMYMQLTEEDIQSLQDCCDYLEVKPAVMIKRPGGVPAIEPTDATHGRRPNAGRPAGEPRPYVVVALVAKGTENAIRAVENNTQDYEEGRRVEAVRRAVEQAHSIASRIVAQADGGSISLSDTRDAADALLLLAAHVRERL